MIPSTPPTHDTAMMWAWSKCGLQMNSRNAADVIPMLCTRAAASRLSSAVNFSTSTESGKATTPPPKGVEPAMNDPNTMASVAGQY